LQGLSNVKEIPQENYSKHDNRSKELGIPLAKKTIRVHLNLHHPSPEIGEGEK
jgi:hypothetical protein